MSAPGRALKRLAAVGCVTIASVATVAPPAGATMTIGGITSGSPPPATCSGASMDQLQPTSVFTAAYFARAAGTITSWSTNASSGLGQIWVMKVFRKVADPATYKVVGHDGPRTLAPGILNTFTGVNITVQPGDILGFNSSGASSACSSFAFNDQILTRSGNLSDGSTATFGQTSNLRLNISAVLSPFNSFGVAGVAKNKANGTATMTINVSNPGLLTVAGKGVGAASAGRNTATKSAAKETTQAGPVDVRIKATGKARRSLIKKGSVKVAPRITFTPFNGDAASQSFKVKLKQR